MSMYNNDIHILLVDDEPDIREILRFNLEHEGYLVEEATSGKDALKQLSEKHQLILLDVMMDGISGFKLADQLRKNGNQTPIIFLTAKDTENDMLTGFSIGGDDYITKPFSIKEVLARVKSVLKRASIKSSTSKNLEFEDLKFNLSNKTIQISGLETELTKTEYEILYLLLSNKEQIFSRSEILDKVWKEDGYVLERTVDVHITRLRKKIGKYGNYIISKSGYGYSFTDK